MFVILNVPGGERLDPHLAVPVNLGGALLGASCGAVDDGVNAHQGCWQGGGVIQIRLHDRWSSSQAWSHTANGVNTS